ncbi:TetR/AcrR family transcriptional regulator [Streptomyces tendae]|uniref:TetR/AcrR family transcriptional regulator n=1 Tax=Streptomyces tendae TaxID=1932 RepID=A0ABX5ZVK6_STRTE|nr:TetR/AcrR family transcriptional regulator [Streptomyces tendae]QER87561.1 TetR/AcrR family transcriptional regulator [Streptomyces tendae]
MTAGGAASAKPGTAEGADGAGEGGRGGGAVVRRPGGRSARIRGHVLRAVRELLVERGYDALSVDAVAERAAVHRTTVYRRWRDVGGLLADVLDAAGSDGWQPPDTGTLEGDLAALNSEVEAGLTGEPVTAALIAASFRSPEAASALRRFWEDRYARCAVVVERGVARGECPAGTCARRVLVASTAPVYQQVLLMRGGDDPLLARQAARGAALAAAGGVFFGGRQG